MEWYNMLEQYLRVQVLNAAVSWILKQEREREREKWLGGHPEYQAIFFLPWKLPRHQFFNPKCHASHCDRINTQ
jgi:hypothetical protein